MDDTLIRSATVPLLDSWSRSASRLEGRLQETGSARGAAAQSEMRKAGQEFESLFIAYLLKIMRETIEEASGSEGGYGKEIYTELFDQEIARLMAQRGILGISDMIAGCAAAPAAEGERTAPGEPAPGTGSAPENGGDIPDIKLPVQAPVSSRFGMRSDPFAGRPRFHKGLDLAAPAGTEVRAALGGEVVYSGYRPGYGNMVLLKHEDGLETMYAHLESAQVRRGDLVESEQVLGAVGSTGKATGSHLHFEVIRRGVPQDPEKTLAE